MFLLSRACSQCQLYSGVATIRRSNTTLRYIKSQRSWLHPIPRRNFHEYSSGDEDSGPEHVSHQPESTRLRLLTTGSLAFSRRSRRRGDGRNGYAILSHTWRSEGNEISFREMKYGDRQDLACQPTWDKIEQTNRQAQRDGFAFFWIDSCCIDKSSSAELSEAINSMYDWYANARVCYVHLEDFDISSTWDDFRSCRWFTRAWTLQELLAPPHVKFFDRFWNYVGSLEDETLLKHVSTATGIDIRLLRKELTLEDFSVAQRMSWAAHRTATRVEDLAYSLMGLFDVHMPMLYGEGRRSFTRLQEEIISTSTDHSIFCWQHTNPDVAKDTARTLLASSPSAFAGCNDIVQRPGASSKPFAMTNLGLEITLPLHSYFPSGTRGRTFVRMNCFRENRPEETLGLDLQRTFDLDTGDAYLFQPWLSSYRSRRNQVWDVYVNRRFDWQFVSAFARRGFVVGHSADSPRLRSCPTSDRDFRMQTIIILRRPTMKSTQTEPPASIMSRAFDYMDPATSLHVAARTGAAMIGLFLFFAGVALVPWTIGSSSRRSGIEFDLVHSTFWSEPPFERVEKARQKLPVQQDLREQSHSTKEIFPSSGKTQGD